MVGETINLSGQSTCTPVKVPDCRLSDDLEQLFDHGTFSDVTLCVAGREFQAHKAILAGKYVYTKTILAGKYMYMRLYSQVNLCTQSYTSS